MSPWFLPGMNGTTPPATVLVTLLLAFVLGQAVAWLYAITHRGLSYSRNMVHSLVLLTMIISVVMLVVGDSMARAFGLVGAVALVRFRTVVRDARDTTFIFLALAVGIAVGVGHHILAVAGTVAIGGAAALMQVTNFGVRHADTGTLRVRGAGIPSEFKASLDDVLAEWCRSAELIALKDARTASSTGKDAQESELSFEIRLFHPKDREPLLAAVRAVPGTTSASVALEDKAEEW